MRAPSARQTETGIGLTSAPSISQRPLICTGRKMPGSANDAFSAFTRLPLLSHTSCPVPSSVATATNLRSSCSMLNCWRCCSSRVLKRCPVIRPEPAKLKSRKPKMRRRVRPQAKSSSAFSLPVTKQAPATAPIEVPATISGSSPAAIRLFSTPICAQPRAAPPPRAMPIVGLAGTHHAQGPSRRGSGRSRPHPTILLFQTGVAECDESSRGSYYSELFKVPFAAPA